MTDPNAPASSRVRAAQSVLDCAARAIEIDEIEARLGALERTVKRDDQKSAGLDVT